MTKGVTDVRGHFRKSRYYGLNDFNLRWIAWNDWIYTANLDLAKLLVMVYVI